MEPASWIIIGLAIFGGWQTKEHIDAERELAQKQAQVSELVEVSEHNAIAIQNIRVAANQCAAELIETRQIQIDFERIKADNEVRIIELENLLNANDWSRVRIPSTILDSINE
jgi:hypothetical protein